MSIFKVCSLLLFANYLCLIACIFILQMQETQRDVSLDREPLADSVRSCEFLCCCCIKLLLGWLEGIFENLAAMLISDSVEVWLREGGGD